jgi:hypothetical protein
VKFLSIYKSVERGGPPSPDEMRTMGNLVEEGMRSGYLLAVEGCMPSATGARVRLSAGNLTVTNGPFSESKEVVGGLAILQTNSKEQAIEHVKNLIRIAGEGECELRQLFETGQDTPETRHLRVGTGKAAAS